MKAGSNRYPAEWHRRNGGLPETVRRQVIQAGVHKTTQNGRQAGRHPERRCGIRRHPSTFRGNGRQAQAADQADPGKPAENNEKSRPRPRNQIQAESRWQAENPETRQEMVQAERPKTVQQVAEPSGNGRWWYPAGRKRQAGIEFQTWHPKTAPRKSVKRRQNGRKMAGRNGRWQAGIQAGTQAAGAPRNCSSRPSIQAGRHSRQTQNRQANPASRWHGSSSTQKSQTQAGRQNGGGTQVENGRKTQASPTHPAGGRQSSSR